MSEVVESKEVVEQAAQANEQQTRQIDVDAQTAFGLKMQEYDKKIAEAELAATQAQLAVSQLKSEKASYIYDENVKQVVRAYEAKMVQQQVEEEARKRLSEQSK
jgi:fructose-specific phosphotransferase system component IIB